MTIRHWLSGRFRAPALKTLVHAVGLLLIIALFLFLTIYFSWPSIFSDPIKYAADDGVYHMRLIENMLLGQHFPHRLFYDPLTYFPYGAYTQWGPFYEYPLAFIIWLASFGHPTLDLINTIAPFYPPALGALAVLTVYFIGRALWDKNTGLVAAALAAVSEPLLFRSLLGATDYHQAEALYSSLAMLFLILAIRGPRHKKFLLWTILAGVSLALYFLVFKGALLFLLIIFLFIFGYYLIEYLAGRNHLWLLKTGLIIFVLPLVAISFFYQHPDIFHSRLYDIRYPVAILMGMALWLLLGGLGYWLEKKRVKRWSLPLALLGLGLAAWAAAKFGWPNFYQAMLDTFRAVNNGMTPYPLIRELVGEMAPLTIGGAFDTFSCLFYLSLVVWLIFILKFIKNRQPQHLLLIIWYATIVIISGAIWPGIGLRRYNYYLSVLIALLAGWLIIRGLKLARRGLSLWRHNKQGPQSVFLLLGSLLIIFNLFYFVFYPFPLNLIESFPDNLPKIFIKAFTAANFEPIIVKQDWYDTYKWLKSNTPDPGLDYYGLYDEPPFNPATGKPYPYPYPDTAYGIMASWDIGHMLLYYAHRYPIANPFQLGIGKITDGKIDPGETTFFIETNETKACQMLDILKARYVITDFEGAYAFSAFATKPEWAENSITGYYTEKDGMFSPNDNYDNSMAARLHLLDGRAWQPPVDSKATSTITALHHFRLIYESSTPSAYTNNLFTNNSGEVKMVKIFEYVKGAVVSGTAPKDATVTLSTKVVTNQNRTFVWQLNAKAKDGKFSFVVPYSTGKPIAGGTNFAVRATTYQLTIGKIKKSVPVTEADIIRGKEIKISTK